jgi:hypothetical protein
MSRIERSDVAKQTLRSEVARDQIQQYEKGKAKAPANKTKDAKPTDELTRGRTAAAPAADSAQQGPAAGTARGANPFAKLSQQLAGFELPPRVLAKALGMEADVDVPAKLLEGLGDVESAAAGMQSEGLSTGLRRATAKVRQGLMLTLSDGVDSKCNDGTKVPRGLTSHISQSIADIKDLERSQAAMKNAMFAAKGHFPAGMDVNAFVQAVLRESYLLQCEIMKDYAEKVKFYNDLKKKIRAELRRARNSLSNAAGLEDTAQLDPPFMPIDFDDDQMVLEDAAGGLGSQDGIDEAEKIISERPEPEAGVTDATSYTSDEMLEALRNGEELGIWYAGKYVVLSGSPPDVQAAYGDRMLDVTITEDDFGAVIELRKLPHMHQTLDLLRIDSFGNTKQIRESGSPDVTDGFGMTSDEIEAALRNGETVSLKYNGEVILLKPLEGDATTGTATYKGKEVSYSFAADENGKLLKITGMPGMHQDKEWLQVDSYGTFSRARIGAGQVQSAGTRDTRLTKNHGDGNHKSVGYITDLATEMANKIKASLPPEGSPERAALIRELESNGMSYGLRIGEKAGNDDWYYTTENGYGEEGDKDIDDDTFEQLVGYKSTPGKPPGKSLEKYIEDVVTDALTAFKDDVRKRESGVHIHKVDFRFRLPTFSVTDPETELTELTGSPSDVPPSESEVDSALVGQNAEQAGLESESQAFSAWQEGEPVETKADLDAYVENLEEKLQTTGDDAQLANVDLQNALQQQQQTLQMMSNISKMLHDTAMSIIRKLGS